MSISYNKDSLRQSDRKQSLSISVCVPALNEENGLRGAVEDLRNILSPYLRKIEIIIVNDGSADRTAFLAEQIAEDYPEVKVIHHAKRLGVGACFRDALTIASGEYFTWFPADRENLAEEFIQCLPLLTPKTLVTCHHRGQDHRFFLRRWVSVFYASVLNGVFHLDIRYYNGLTIFPTSVLRSLRLVADGFIFLAESLIYSIKSGCAVVQLSAPLKKREGGKSKMFTWLSLKQTLKDIFRILLGNLENANKSIQ